MCTSTGSKPARSNTAAISRWLFTPCSRNTATRGRTPRLTKGAATSSSGENVSDALIPGSSARDALELFVCARRIVAHPLHAIARLRPTTLQSRSIGVEQQCCAAPRTTIRRRCCGAPRSMHVLGEPDRGEPLPHLRNVGFGDLQYRPQFLGEQRRDRIGFARRAEHSNIDVEPAAPGERHLERARPRGRRPIDRDRQRLRRRAATLARYGRNRASRPASSTSGHVSPSCRCVCASALPPRRFAPPPRSTSNSRVRPRSRRSTGVAVLRTSGTGANAETISVIGAVTACSPRASRHCGMHRQAVLADRNRDPQRGT